MLPNLRKEEFTSIEAWRPSFIEFLASALFVFWEPKRSGSPDNHLPRMRDHRWNYQSYAFRVFQPHPIDAEPDSLKSGLTLTRIIYPRNCGKISFPHSSNWEAWLGPPNRITIVCTPTSMKLFNHPVASFTLPVKTL